MSERDSIPWSPLTPEQSKSVPNGDHTSIFSRDEVLAALQQLVPSAEATAIADDLYGDEGEPGVFFYGELLTALSRISASAAERVRAITAESPEGPPPPTK